MPKTLRIPRKRISLGSAATLLIFSSLGSQILGFMRTKLVNANFQAIGPSSTDSYFAAFNIPDFFFFTLAAGALGVAFMPVLAERLHKGDRKGIWDLSTSLLNLLAMVMVVVGLIMLIFAPQLIHYVVAPNLTQAQLHNAVIIMRFLSFNPFLFMISGILASVQQTLGRFFFYAIAPLFYNLSIITSIFIFKHNIGLVGLGIGAFIGAVIQLAIVSIGLVGTGFHWKPKILWKSSDFRVILRQLPPRSLDQGIDQIESIIETNFARRLGEGFISYYNNAYTLSTAPTLLIGTAISTAAFPQLNNRLAQGRPDLFRKEFLKIVRVMVWLSTPVVIISYFTRGYLARLIFSRDAPQIATIFGFLAMAIFFSTLYTIISRWFYAHKDTKVPLLVSLFTIGLNIFLVSQLARPSTYGVSGLAIAQSLVAFIEVAVLTLIMLYRDPALFDKEFWLGILRIISVTGFTMVASFIMISLLPLGVNDRGIVTLGGKLFLIAAITGLVHIGVSALFGIEEVRPVFYRVRKIILKPIRIIEY